jgi:formylglycine-generating enzyme required for sulfatase activity
MRLCFFASLVLICLALPIGSAQAQGSDQARKKCIEFGFKDKTPSHDSCVKQFLQSTGAAKAPAKPVAPPAWQSEEKFWDATLAAGNKGAFEAYLENYPLGRYAGLARANVTRLAGVASAQQQAQAEAAVKLAADRAAFEAEQKLARERAATEAAQKVTDAEAARRAANTPRSGQIIKDCADCPEMVVIPAGSFNMGSNDNADERPIHRVNVSGFLLGKTEVTQGQWKAMMGSNPSRFNQCGDDCPVEQVSGYEAQEFARRLSLKTGKAYRLPSESEWEYAARAGSDAKWSFGDSENQLGDYAWYSRNSQNQSQRVAQKRPNAFGIFDMHGNVWEWVEDCSHDDYNGAPADGRAWTTTCSGNYQVFRGGSWRSFSSGQRPAVRAGLPPVSRSPDIGFRLARTL